MRHPRRHFFHRRQIRMNEVIHMLEPAGFAEEQVFDAALQFDIFDPLEPYQLALVGAIEERSAETLRFADTDGMPFGYFTDDLDVGVFILQFGNAIETAAVDILIRKDMQHIERSIHIELFTKNVGTFGTDILTIGYISIG